MQRINLSQARKRAKGLVRRGDAAKLAEAQREVARELGFASWPRLVAHVEAASIESSSRVTQFVDWATNGRRDRAQALLDIDPSLARREPEVELVLGAAVPDNPNAPLGSRDWPPLLYVTYSAFLGGDHTAGLIRCARALLDAGADVNAAWEHPEFGSLSALYGAAGLAHDPGMTALLLAGGADPNDGESLYHACETRDHRCLRLLLDAGARVDGSNAVAHMLDYDDPDGLRLLLDADATSLDGAVTWALGRGRSREHIELLIDHGAPVPDDAATLAVRRGRSELADLLGPGSPSASDRLLGAIRRRDRDSVNALVTSVPGLLASLGRGDHDALVLAAAAGDLEVVKLMLELAFPVDVRSEEFEETPLHAAAWYGRTDVVRVLLDHGAGANVEAGPPFGGAPLDWAARGSTAADPTIFTPERPVDHEQVVEQLVHAGAGLLDRTSAEAATERIRDLL